MRRGVGVVFRQWRNFWRHIFTLLFPYIQYLLFRFCPQWHWKWKLFSCVACNEYCEFVFSMCSHQHWHTENGAKKKKKKRNKLSIMWHTESCKLQYLNLVFLQNSVVSRLFAVFPSFFFVVVVVLFCLSEFEFSANATWSPHYSAFYASGPMCVACECVKCIVFIRIRPFIPAMWQWHSSQRRDEAGFWIKYIRLDLIHRVQELWIHILNILWIPLNTCCVTTPTERMRGRQRFNLNMSDVNLKDLTKSLTAFARITSMTGPPHTLPVCLTRLDRQSRLHSLRNLIQQHYQQQKLGITPAPEPE